MTNSACDGWGAIRPTAQDIEVMSASLVTQILKHDEHGRKKCGWRTAK